jgi:uncharacterized MnhB-related membrane protein
MVWQLELALFLMLVVTAVVALSLRDLLAAVATLTAFSFFSALLMAMMGAVDVAMTEVALGSGITGVLFIAGIVAMDRRSVD